MFRGARRGFALTILSVGLAACTPVEPAPPPIATVATATGLRIVDDGREIGFGRDWANVYATMTVLFGEATGEVPCPAGGFVTQWPGAPGLGHDGRRFLRFGCPA